MTMEFQVTQAGFRPLSVVDRSGNPFSDDVLASRALDVIRSFCSSGDCPANNEGRCLTIGLIKRGQAGNNKEAVYILDPYGGYISETDCAAKGSHQL